MAGRLRPTGPFLSSVARGQTNGPSDERAVLRTFCGQRAIQGSRGGSSGRKGHVHRSHFRAGRLGGVRRPRCSVRVLPAVGDPAQCAREPPVLRGHQCGGDGHELTRGPADRPGLRLARSGRLTRVHGQQRGRRPLRPADTARGALCKPGLHRLVHRSQKGHPARTVDRQDRPGDASTARTREEVDGDGGLPGQPHRVR